MASKRAKSHPKERDAKAVLGDIQHVLDELPDAYDHMFRPGKILWYSYLKGILNGLGLITAFAIVVPIVVWFLRGIQWVPLLGDVVTDIVSEVEQARQR